MLKINEFLAGFKLLRYEYIEEIATHAYLMEHVKSGAHLLFLGNEDDNKVFNIGFRTPPADDSGIPHILEHSCLCGSRKYRLKEPFVDLVKGSMNTFLNAMTYPDKTVYPVASRNNKDFHNLMDVYLDAVFYPLIYENPYTLLQEGWHYELESPEDELYINGVVYNEMKGAYSSADAELGRLAMRALFPNNCYKFESGGYPEAIPDLSQEQFLNFHKTYYSPENSYIVLYGDMDMKETLSYLDAEYLSHFSKTNQLDLSVKTQAPSLRTQEVTSSYVIDSSENLEGKTYHELSIVTGNKAQDNRTIAALGLLEGVLLETESGPLRRALLDAHIGSSISGSFSSDLLQPIFSIKVSGSELEYKDKFISTIYKTLQDITINGLDKKLLEAALDCLEFKVREADYGPYPKGLMYSLSILGTWLYGADPFTVLKYEDDLKFLRDGLTNNYYETIIEQYLLDNTHKVIVSLVPDPEKAERDAAKEKAKLAKIKSNMTQVELEEHTYKCKELHRLQNEPDSEAARESIPLLERSDIRRETRFIEREVERIGESNLIYMPVKNNKIVYTSWAFDITGMRQELLPYTFIFVDVLGKFDTKDYSYQDLVTATIKYTGGITYNVSADSKSNDADSYKIHFKIRAKCLGKNLSKMLELITSTGKNTIFNNKSRLKELLEDIKADWEDNFFSRGQTTAISRIFSYVAKAARVNELDHLSHYKLIKYLVDNFDYEADNIIAKLKEILRLCFSKRKYHVAYTCNEASRALVRDEILKFINSLNYTELQEYPEILSSPGLNEGIITPGKVQYVVMGGNFQKHGYIYTGAMKVLEKLLSYEYLWIKLRIQGGAYGASSRFYSNGLMYLSSYRDPQLPKTVSAYKELADWIENINLSERELTKYVIGAMSGIDTPLTTSMMLDDVMLSFLKGITKEMNQTTRNEILDVTNEDLRTLAPIIRATLSDNYICVVGGRQVINDNNQLFKIIINP